MKANAAAMSRRRMLTSASAATAALRAPATAGAIMNDPALASKGSIDEIASDREILALYAERKAG
jgi:hypothetical protein